MSRPQEYRHIRAWGKLMGSYEYYITAQQELAAAQNAPLDAIYERNGEWHTFKDIKSEDTKAAVLRKLEKQDENLHRRRRS